MKKPKFFRPTSGHTRSPSYPKPPIRAPRKVTMMSNVSTLTDAELKGLDEALGDTELIQAALSNVPDDDVQGDGPDGGGVASINRRFLDSIVARLAAPLSYAIEHEFERRFGHIEEMLDDVMSGPKQSTVTIQGGRARFKVTRKKADAPKGKKKIAAETVERRIERGEDGKITHVIDTKSDGTVVRHEVRRDMDGNMTGVISETFVDAPPSLLERAKQQ